MLNLGEIVVTSTINTLMNENLDFYAFIHQSLHKHRNLDFGELCKEDIKLNMDSVKLGNRVLSMYKTSIPILKNKKIYIITEADRKCTTVLFPNEY